MKSFKEYLTEVTKPEAKEAKIKLDIITNL